MNNTIIEMKNTLEGINSRITEAEEWVRTLEERMVEINVVEQNKENKNEKRDLPGGPVVRNPPSNAGDTGSIPGGGTKIPHASGQLIPHATTIALSCLN